MRRASGGLLTGLVWMSATTSAGAAIVTEVYTDRAAFEARLGGNVAVVDFDDVDTSVADPVPFDADRYAATAGMVITGEGGQYASRDFGFPGDFPHTSLPNLYAPGPVGADGANDTDVTFVSGGGPALVTGFGALVIDADFPEIGESSLAVFDAADRLLASEVVSGPDGSQLFRGIVTVDDQTGEPVPAIRRAHLVNGTEWPANDVGDDVALDDFVAGTVTAAIAGTPIAGRKLVLKAGLLKAIGKDPAVRLGAGNGSVDDPVAHGGSLRVTSSAGGAFDATYDLPSGGWRYIKKAGKNKGYKFNGGDVVKVVVVKPGKLVKVVAKGMVGPGVETDPSPVGVVVGFGTQTFCMSFGGMPKFKPGKKLVAKNAAPGDCPDAAPACGFPPDVAPPGSYAQSCQSCSVDGTVLTCQCRKVSGSFVGTMLDFASCDPERDLSNLDGTLTCTPCPS